MRSCGVLWILPRPFGDGLSRGRCESGAREDPRTIRQRMDRFDLSGFSRQPERLGRDLQNLCGVAKVEPRLDPVLRGLEHRDVVGRARLYDSRAGPAIAVARLDPVDV